MVTRLRCWKNNAESREAFGVRAIHGSRNGGFIRQQVRRLKSAFVVLDLGGFTCREFQLRTIECFA
jgi:hypothetical protein